MISAEPRRKAPYMQPILGGEWFGRELGWNSHIALSL